MRRYIDADKLKEFYKPYAERKLSVPVDVILLNIDDMPTEDVEELRHGRWTTERTIEHDGEMYCDQCGWTWENLTFDRTKVKKSPYCPNCGAKMEV